MSEATETTGATPVETSEAVESTGAVDALGSGAESGAAGGNVAGDAVAAARAENEAQARRWRLKVDGKEHEVASEEELLTLAQKGLGADRRFEEAAAQRKEAQTLRQQIEAAAQRMADDPAEILTALHGDEGRAAQIAAQRMLKRPAYRTAVLEALLGDPEARSLAEQRLLEQIEYESLPEAERRKIDEQRMLRARAARADELEATEKKRAEQAAKRQAEERFRAEEARFRATFTEEAKTSLAAVGLDPSDPDIVERWAMHRAAAAEHGVEMTATEAAQRVAEREKGRRKATIDGLAQLEGEALLAAIPKAVLDKISAAHAARVKSGQRAAARAAQAGKGAAQPRPKPAPARRYSTDAMMRGYRTLGIAETKRRMAAGEPLDP